MCENKMLEAALEYHSWGWSIIPIHLGGEKRPAVRWKRFQFAPASEENIRKWFKEERGVAVIFGEVSGHLASRDFDLMATYDEWAAGNPELASTLPTVQTKRGMHVYFRLDPNVLRSLRLAMCKPDGRGAINYIDGELRVGEGCYSVLPPTPHTGGVYEWITKPDKEVPFVDLAKSGLFVAYNNSLATSMDPGGTGSQWGHGESPGFSYNPDFPFLHAVYYTIPESPGSRNRMIFELAVRIKSIPGGDDLNLDQLRQLVQVWHELSLPNMNTKHWDETWVDFLRAWKRAVPGEWGGGIAKAYQEAMRKEPPKVVESFDSPELKNLIRLCKELQATTGDKPFFLASRAAGEMLGISKVKASRWLFLLVTEGVLELVEKGNFSKKKASTYRYLAD